MKLTRDIILDSRRRNKQIADLLRNFQAKLSSADETLKRPNLGTEGAKVHNWCIKTFR